MIESNIINYVELGDSFQKIDVFNYPFLCRFFDGMKNILKYKPTNYILFYLLKIIYFLQIILTSTINLDEERIKKDTFLLAVRGIKKIIYFHENINNRNNYIFVFCCCTAFIFLFMIIFLITIFMKKKNEKIYNILNYFLLILTHYGFYPLMNVCLISFKCEKNEHIFLKKRCFKNYAHIVIFLLSIISLIFIFLVAFITSIFYHQCGGRLNQCSILRTNSNYEIIEFFTSLIIYVFGYILTYEKYSHDLRNIGKGLLILISLINIIYYDFYVFYYDNRMNMLNYFGWSFSLWFALVRLLSSLLKVYDTLIFTLVGWVISVIIIILYNDYLLERTKSKSDLFEFHNIKEIEMFINILISLAFENSNKSKVILNGIIETSEEYFKTTQEVYEKYEKFLNNEYLNKKFNKEKHIFSVYNIINVIYNYYLTKTDLKFDIILLYCNFLMNHLKNPTYVISICTKIKFTGYKYLYLKYLLMEDIKDFLIDKITKNYKTKESIKHIQVTSVILFNYYLDQMKLKIYDAACVQIDYFDILRNNSNSSKITYNFLKIGKNIISLRNEILNIWANIIKLNPFSDEAEKDYLLYLETIIQDEELAEKEDKIYNQIKLSKLSEKNSIYFSLFLKETSSILLIDGYSTKGKILYTTINFPILFNFASKAILNLNINELIPNNVASFHDELIKDTIKYSNFSQVFNKYKNVIIKGKNNSLFRVKLYIRAIPNLSYGLIYIINLIKIQDNKFLILLDDTFHIESMSFPNGNLYSLNELNSFGLSGNIIGHHIACIIPDCLKHIKYNQNTQKYIVSKNDIELKSELYPNNENLKIYDNIIKNIMEKIKHKGLFDNQIELTKNKTLYIKQNTKNFNLNKIEKENVENLKEYKELIKMLENNYAKKSIGIFYKIIIKSFLNDKYSYCKLYITQDFMGRDNNPNNESLSKTNFAIYDSNFRKKISLFDSEVKLNKNKNKKAIKIREFDNEEKPLIINKNEQIKENNNESKEKKNKEEEEKNIVVLNNPFLNNYNKKLDEKKSISSLSSKSSLDSASFNKLKNKIFKESEPKHISLMKINILLFVIGTVILIFLNNSDTKSIFDHMQKYLEENIFFNRSTISTSCVYIITSYLKLMKYNIIENDFCGYSNCENNLLIQYTSCLDTIKVNFRGIDRYNIDYREMLNEIFEIKLYIFSLNISENIRIDTSNFLYSLLTNLLRLKENYTFYINNTDINNEMDVYAENILYNSYDYINNEKFGLSTVTKQNITKNKYKDSVIFMIINIIIFCITIFFNIWIILLIYKIEFKFLHRLIFFNTNNFTIYLKYLDELKKKLRNETQVEDDNNIDDSSNNNNEKSSKKNNNNKFEEKKRSKKNLEQTIQIRNKNVEKKTRKKQQNKMNKIQQQKNEKFKIMKRFFIIYNIIITGIISLLLFLAIIYYTVEILYYLNRKNNFFNFDIITDDIESIFVDCNLIIVNLKNEVIKYLNHNILKERFIIQLQNNLVSNVSLNELIYTKENITELENSFYSMNIPNRDDIVLPQISYSLVKLFKGINKNKEGELQTLYKLFYDNICDLLFSEDELNYNICYTLWDGILTQGIEQSIIQFGIEIYNILEDLNNINSGKLTINSIFNINGSLGICEIFIIFVFLPANSLCEMLLEIIRQDKVNSINKTFDYILYIFLIALVICWIVVFFFIKKIKDNFNSFLNFIGIIPIQYLSEDDKFYREILRLERTLYI